MYFSNDFAFGIAPTTAARAEAHTKKVELSANILLSGNMKKNLNQYLDQRQRDCITRIDKEKVNIFDGKENGQFLWSVNKEGIEYFTRPLM